eukprot:3371779-Pyramimonas_sp.AAC.1
MDFLKDKDGHQQFARAACRDDLRLARGERVSSRDWAKANIPYILDYERPLDPDEPEEPHHVSY